MNESSPTESTRKSRLRYVRLMLVALFFAMPAMGGLLTLLQVLRAGVGGVDGVLGAAGIAVGPDGRHVYAVGRNDNALAVFRRDPANGVLEFVEVHRDNKKGVFGLVGVSDVATSPDDRHVFVTAEIDDTLAMFSRDATQDDLSFVANQLKEDGVAGVSGLRGASSVTVSPDDELVFVTAAVDDALVVFSRDASEDDLTFKEAELNGMNGVSGLDGASDVAVSPDSRHVYVASETDDAIAVFKRTGDSVEQIDVVIDGVGDVQGLEGASGVAVSPDGRHVYATGRLDNALVLFDRNSLTGLLSFRAFYRDGLAGVDGLRGAADVTLKPDGTRVLVAGRYDDAVAIFRRNNDGTLAFFEILRDGDTVDGLAGVAALAASSDGENAYAASQDDDAVVGFGLPLCDGDDATGDSDGDAFCDDVDLCQGDDLTGDSDTDGICDDVDLCQGNDATGDTDTDGVCDNLDACQGDDATGDSDTDGICDDLDICFGNDLSGDSDLDGRCDNIDLCQGDDTTGDTDGDGRCNDIDLCQGDDLAGDSDTDGVCDDVDLCQGDDATGDADTDGLCADLDCDDNDALNLCELFADGFESGNTSSWSGAVGGAGP